MNGEMLYGKIDCISKKNDEYNLCFNEELSISQDNVLRINDEPQKMSINDLCLTSLEECFEGVGSKDIILQKIHAEISLVIFQVTCI